MYTAKAVRNGRCDHWLTQIAPSTARYYTYQQTSNDIYGMAQTDITPPQWLHLDGHAYDIERSQSSSHQTYRQHQEIKQQGEDFIGFGGGSLTSLNFVYQTAKSIYTACLIALPFHQVLTHIETSRACACRRRSGCSRRSACRGRPG